LAPLYQASEDSKANQAAERGFTPSARTARSPIHT
jgi:hypothetical protein